MIGTESLLNELFRNPRSVFLITDEAYNIRYASETVEAVFGVKPISILGRNTFEFVPHDKKDAWRQCLEEAGHNTAGEINLVTTAGAELHFDVTVTNHINSHGIKGLVVYMHNITERMQTDKGIVKGVFGWPAIHVRDAAKEEAPSMKNIFIDIGAASKREVEAMGVHVGCVATFEDELTELNKNFLVGRALDNRMGGFMIAEVARRLSEKKKKLPFCLYVVNAVQEEIGLRGAEMISRRLKPDLAICTDVTHDTQSPMYNKKESGNLKCGNGPTLCYGPAVQNNVLKMIIDVANKKKIPFQRQAVSRSTGTDTDSFAYSAEGVASALISLPLKYMHTTVEMVHKDDVENVINLIYEVLLQVKPGHDFRYIR